MDKNTLLSNNEYLQTELDKILTIANKMSINSKTYDISINNSSTNIPAIEPTYIKKLITSSKELQQKFITDINNLKEIGEKFASVDVDLKNNAEKFNMEVAATKLGNVVLNNTEGEDTDYSLSKEAEEIINDITIPSIDLDKYAENAAAGFYLWISSTKYTLEDFVNSRLRGKYNYSPEQALEAFIACVIAESDKTIDDTLAVTSVILNRCESSNWGPYYQNGTNPFDQLFANNGGQFAVITSDVGGIKRYQKYMPSVVGKAKVDEYLKAYGATYEELRDTVLEALEGGVRNNDYTGYRASGYGNGNESIRITRKGNKYRFENPSVDSAIAKKRRANRKKVDLSGTSYNSSRQIYVENGADLNNLSNSLAKSDNAFRYNRQSQVGTTGNNKQYNNSNQNTNTNTNSNTNPNTNPKVYNQRQTVNDGGTSKNTSPVANNNSNYETDIKNDKTPQSDTTEYNEQPKNNNQNYEYTPNYNSTPNEPTQTFVENNTPLKENIDNSPMENIDIDETPYEYPSNDNYIPDNSFIPSTPTVNYKENELSTNNELLNNTYEDYNENLDMPTEPNSVKTNPLKVAAGITAAIGGVAGIAAYGMHEYKKKKESEENEDTDGDY